MYVEQQQDISQGYEQNRFRYQNMFKPPRIIVYTILTMLIFVISTNSYKINEYTNKTNEVDSINTSFYNGSMIAQHHKKRIPRALSNIDLPDDRGYFDVYIRRSCHDERQNPFEQVRFPYARYNRRQYRFSRSWIRFSRWMPIYANIFNRHTMIYSSNGVYILPPLITAYGRLISLAELMAYGYATMLKTHVLMPSYFDAAYYAHSGAYLMRGMPRFNPEIGVFMGGVQSQYQSQFKPECDHEYEEHTGDEEPISYEEEDNDEYKKPERKNNYYYRRRYRPRPYDTTTIKEEGHSSEETTTEEYYSSEETTTPEYYSSEETTTEEYYSSEETTTKGRPSEETTTEEYDSSEETTTSTTTKRHITTHSTTHSTTRATTEGGKTSSTVVTAESSSGETMSPTHSSSEAMRSTTQSTSETTPAAVTTTSQTTPTSVTATGETTPDSVKTSGETASASVTTTGETIPALVKKTTAIGKTTPESVKSTGETTSKSVATTSETTPTSTTATGETIPASVKTTAATAPSSESSVT
ncbi:unnamed protein product [Adineta steineri]|uniref:Uncharacterized protein n=1 Tax=Adineta steineri TaxID=433720 RepID=A0A814WJL2_9BILA|nr:unnamed protein product [Adineta steineri]CAF3944952.1 unnamed protein product [Adineta steineri]